MKQGIIIGASSGIGWELAVQLAAQGYQLGLMARRDGCLKKLADSLPGQHFVQVTDLANAEQAQAAGEAGEAAPDGDAVDAEFEEVKEDKEQKQ